MDRRIGLFAGLTALLAMGSAHAQSCPGVEEVATGINDETGHTFFLYKFPSTVAAADRTWVNADACVSDLDDLSGVPAHLATITSSSENTWIIDELLRPTLPPDNPATPDINENMISRQVWVGGVQTLDSATPGARWSWVNNEGPFCDQNGLCIYTNWAFKASAPSDPAPIYSEPNDSPTSGENNEENHLTVGRFEDNLYGWNDEGSNLSSIYGFIVEYDTPRTKNAGCTTLPGTTTTECETVEGQSLTFPPGTVIGANNGFTFTAYEFTDPRVDADGRCSGIGGVRGPLSLFEGDEFNLPPDGKSGKLVIPEYLCGSPKFLVVRALPFGGGINIPRGVVLTENNTLTIPNLQNPGSPLPGILPGNLYDCNAPIPASKSGQQQDVGVWQSLDATEMWENAAAELTTGCGSTIYQSRGKSNFVVGLHIDFGPDVGYRTPDEYNEFVALTQYKISMVRMSVVEARRIGTISDANGRAMLSQLDSAAGSLASNNPVGAAKKIQDFLKKVKTSTYSTSLTNPFNYNGDHLSRGENILFTLQHKVIPFKPVP